MCCLKHLTDLHRQIKDKIFNCSSFMATFFDSRVYNLCFFTHFNNWSTFFCILKHFVEQFFTVGFWTVKVVGCQKARLVKSQSNGVNPLICIHSLPKLFTMSFAATFSRTLQALLFHFNFYCQWNNHIKIPNSIINITS